MVKISISDLNLNIIDLKWGPYEENKFKSILVKSNSWDIKVSIVKETNYRSIKNVLIVLNTLKKVICWICSPFLR